MTKNMILLMFLTIFIILRYVHEFELRSKDISATDLAYSYKVWVKKLATTSNCYVDVYEIRLMISGCDTWEAGDTVSLTGKPIASNANRKINQKTLIKKVNVKIGKGDASLKNRVGDFINNLSLMLYKKTQQTFSHLGERKGLLMMGLLFGQSGQLPSDLKQQIQLAGLPFIISVTSYSFTLTIESFFLFANLFPRRKKEVETLSLFSLAFYLLLVGYPAVLQRVLYSQTIDYLSKRIFHRPILPIYRLFLSSLLVLSIAPYSFWDLGLELSVLSSLSVNIFSTPPRLIFNPLSTLSSHPKLRIGKMIWFPISCQILTVPLLLYTFGNVNLISLISSVLIAWILPIVLSFGMGYWLIGQFFPSILLSITFLIKAPLIVFLAEINLLSHNALIIQHQFSLVEMALGYCLISLFIIGNLFYHKRYTRQSFFTSY